MPDIKDLIPESTEDERIRKWREERHRVAEAEKAERIRNRDLARAREAEEEAKRKSDRAAALIPSAADIEAVQKETSRQYNRARRNTLLRFAIICLLPFACAFYYLNTIVTPLYEARSVIAVTKPGAGSEPTNSGFLGSLSSPTNLQEVFMAHEFIRSKAMMDMLEAEIGFVSDLSGPNIDPIQRLRNIDALSYDKQSQFSRFVESSVDIQTGLITVYVRTPDAAQSVAVSDRILGFVADQVNTLNIDVIGQRSALADQTVRMAQEQMNEAQRALTVLQLESGEADPAERIASVYAMINQLEDEALSLGNEIKRAEIAGQGDSFQTQRAIALQSRIEEQIAEQRALLVTGGSSESQSLNAIMMQHQLATLRVTIAEEALTASLAAQAEATQAAALARSLFQVVVPPRKAEIAGSPHIPATLLIVFVVSLAVFALWSVTITRRRAY